MKQYFQEKKVLDDIGKLVMKSWLKEILGKISIGVCDGEDKNQLGKTLIGYVMN